MKALRPGSITLCLCCFSHSCAQQRTAEEPQNNRQDNRNSKRQGWPVLADVADNPGGGGVGDGTAILRELIRQGVKDAAIAAGWCQNRTIEVQYRTAGSDQHVPKPLFPVRPKYGPILTAGSSFR